MYIPKACQTAMCIKSNAYVDVVFARQRYIVLTAGCATVIRVASCKQKKPAVRSGTPYSRQRVQTYSCHMLISTAHTAGYGCFLRLVRPAWIKIP